MVAIFTGAGTGFERGSGAVLGGMGLLGQSSLGRNGEQVMLNAANGNLLITQRDEFLVGRGPDAAISRTYNSQGAFTDDNRDNWRQGTDRRLTWHTGSWMANGSAVKQHMGDGSEKLFWWDGSHYTSTEGGGAHEKLVHLGSGWNLIDGNGQVTETYQDYYGETPGGYSRLIEQTDSSGNKLTYSYLGHNVSRVTTADGGYVDYHWSGNNITHITAGSHGTARTRTRYGYDHLNRLTSVTVDLSPNDHHQGGDAYTTTYGYHGDSRLVAFIAQTDGSRMDFGYDGAGRVTSMTQTVGDAPARTTTIAYGHLHTHVTDATGQLTALEYNADGSLRTVIAPPAHWGAPQQVVRFGYNGNGDLTSVTDAAGRVTSYAHDARGNVISETDRLGNVVTRTFGARNELLTETRIGSDAGSAASAQTTRFAYDGANRLRFVVSAQGAVTEHWYNGYGQLTAEAQHTDRYMDVAGMDPAASLSEAQVMGWRDSFDKTQLTIVENRYDARGNVAERISYGGSNWHGHAQTGDGYTHQYFTYDQTGQLLNKTTASLGTEHFSYDGLGRLIRSTDLNGGATSIVFNDGATQTVVTLANGFVQTSSYNKAGDLVAQTDGGDFVAGGTTNHRYDRLGRLRMTTDATGRNSFFIYDKVGRKVADITHDGHITEYRYDANDRVVASVRYTHGSGWAADHYPNTDVHLDMSQVRPGGHPWDVWNWQVYDADGRVIQSIDGDGGVTAFEYDASDRLVRTTSFANKLAGWQIADFKNAAPAGLVLPPGSGEDKVSRNFYDRDGLLIGAIDGEGYLTRIQYDASGKKVAETAYANATRADLRGGHSLDVIQAHLPVDHGRDRTTRWVYDGQHQLRFTINGFSQVTEYRYEAGATWTSVGLVRETIQYAGSIAALGAYTLASVRGAIAGAGLAGHGANRITRSVYDGAGRLVYAIDATGGVTGLTYDNMGQVTRTIQFANRLHVGHTPSHGEMDGWANGNGHAANRFTRNYYTDRGELRFVVDPEGFITRNDYDAAGRTIRTVRWSNPVPAQDWWDIHTANAHANGAGSWVENNVSYDNAGRVNFTYDGEGNSRHYAYHANGTLAWDIASLGHPEESRTYYENDGAGRTVLEIRAWNTPEQAVSRFGYDGHGNLTVSVDPNGNHTYRGYDKLGRMTRLTDANGGVTTYGYNGFGEAVRATDARGVATYSYHDRLGRVTHVRDGEDYVTETAYTVFGEVDAVTRRYNKTWNGGNTWDAPGMHHHHLDATTRFEYDRLGRVTRTIDAEAKSESYVLDAFGQRIEVRNKIDGTTYNSFDRRGLLVAERLPMASVRNDGAVLAPDVTNRFEYDSRGNRTRMIEAAGLPEQRTTRYAYDRADRLVETRLDAVQPVDQGGYNVQGWVEPTTRIVYDTRGNIVETVDALGARTLFYYDRQNRKTEQVDGLGNMVSWRYDAAGNMVHERRWAVQATWAHGGNKGLPHVTGDDRVTNYTYDRLGRMTSSSLAGVRTGRWDGWNYHVGIGDVTTQYAYDAAGNLVRTIDGNGNATHSYYDRLGRKSREVDAEGYVTGWLYDAEGNVFHERRWAHRTGYADLNGMHDPHVTGEDRVTDFTFDRNGRRLTETRRGVEAYNVNGWGGLDRTSSDSTIRYEYNGLGQVTRKVEATGQGANDNQHDTLYTYDQSGRLITESRAYIHTESGWVRPLVEYAYDGLNNLTRTAQTGRNYEGYAFQPTRTTRYTYKANGRLNEMIDAAGTVFTHWHDVAGNLLVKTWNRNRSDGNSVHEGVLYTRDTLGRVTSQAVGGWNGGWTKGDVQNTQFNSFGDVSARGINGYQEHFAYDTAGRLERSTGGDGVVRAFLYDGVGNQTATIENLGHAHLPHVGAGGAVHHATSGYAHTLGSRHVEGLNVTINAYDRRGQATRTIMTQRQLSTDGSKHDLSVSRGYNAFGEATHEIDARGFRTDHAYNSMGRTLWTQRDWAKITLENGVEQWVRPTEHYFYDQSGRMVGVQDANGNRTVRALLNGTGYGTGGEALVAREHHADNGVIHHGYDAFGDLRRTTDEIGRVKTMTYDAMGRLNGVWHANGLHEAYLSDALGQRIHHYSSGWGYHVTTDYDVQGRVVRSEAFGRDVTHTHYRWDGGLVTHGLGYFGGWVETVTYANGMTSTEHSDVFGRDLWKLDMGGHAFQSVFDGGGRLVRREGGETLHFNVLNTGLVGTVSNGYGSHSRYAYDAAGNRTVEYTERNGAVVQNATAGYDNLGRLTHWNEHGNGTTHGASVIHDYDAAGNIRRTRASTPVLDQQGNFSYQSNTDQWYRFDAMNRVVTQKGQLVGGQIVRGSFGTDYTYDQAGQRRSATRTASRSASIYNPNYNPEPYYDPWGYNYPREPMYGDQYMTVYYDAVVREDYAYDAAGGLSQVRIAESGYQDNMDGTLTVTAAPWTGALKAGYWQDVLGRNFRQIDYLFNGDSNGTAAYDREVNYDGKGQIYREMTFTRSGADTIASETWNEYNGALGAVTGTTAHTWKNGSFQATARTDTNYAWYDGAVASTVRHRASSSAPTFTTSYYYDGNGALTSAYVADGRPRSITYTNDMGGQVIRRDEQDNRYPAYNRPHENGDPHEIWFRFAGKQMGYSGNNGTTDTDYASSIAARTRAAPTTTTGAFRGGAAFGGAHTDFDNSLKSLNSYEQGGAGGGYTVRGGDTLSGIAANLWGDAGLWYKLAEANGLSQQSALTEGQRLTIPSGVTKNTHNAGTFKPYDPAEAIGETSPTNPAPNKAAKKNKCGAFGAILLVIVAVAVTAVTAGAAAAALAPAAATAAGGGVMGGLAVIAGGTALAGGLSAGALIGIGAGAAMAGSIASQGVGVATGIQDKFSWKAVAMAGISGAVGAGLGSFGGAGFVGSAVRGAVGSAITQGIGVATGLQKKFDWAGVAAAGLAAGVESAFSRMVPGAAGEIYEGTGGAIMKRGAATIGHQSVVSMAGAIAEASSLSLIKGTSFGDNLIAALPSAIGRTVGNSIANSFTGVRDRQIGQLGYVVGESDGQPVIVTGQSQAAIQKKYNLPSSPAAMIVGLSLTKSEYIQAVKAGLWKFVDATGPMPDNSTITVFQNDTDVANATAASQAKQPTTALSVESQSDVRLLMAEIANPTRRASLSGGQDFEKFVTVGRNGAGELIVTSIAAVRQGARWTPPAGTVTHLHVHFGGPNGLYQPPHGADDEYARVRGRASFVVGGEDKKLYEVGRQNGQSVVRTIGKGGAFGSWLPYQVKPENYYVNGDVNKGLLPQYKKW